MKLTAASLDRRNAERANTTPLVDLLLSTGAMAGPYTRTRPLVRGRIQRIARRVRTHFLNRSPHR